MKIPLFSGLLFVGISDHHQAGGMRMAPGRGRGHLCWGALIFSFFLISVFIGSIGFDDHLTDSSLASILVASTSLGGGCSAGAYQQIVKNMQEKILSQYW
jgi:hypothetical protein